MSKLILFFLVSLIAIPAMAGKEQPLFDKETADSCYKKPISAAVQNCMIYLSGVKQKEYEGEYNLFIKKTNDVKNTFYNHTDFLQSIEKAKANWDQFIKEECMAEALIDEKESLAYYTDYHSCLTNGYQTRIKYYKSYPY